MVEASAVCVVMLFICTAVKARQKHRASFQLRVFFKKKNLWIA